MPRDLLKIFHECYRELRPRAAMPDFQLGFFAFASVTNTILLRDGRVRVRISDMLEGAPEAVLRAIAHILVAKLYHKQVDPVRAARYRRYLGTRGMAAKAHLVRQLRGSKRLNGTRGHIFDLQVIFDELNKRYFHGLLGRPDMTWSSAASRTHLGHFDPAHNTIVISRIFDHPEVPRYAVEYLVYHEMLHLKYPVKMRGSRRCVHPAAFQAEEKLFSQLEESKAFLRSL